MNNTSKRSAGQGIDSGDRQFTNAVVRLTLYYTAGALVLLGLFSVVIYALFIRALPPFEEMSDEATEVSIVRSEVQHIPEELGEHLVDVLLIADGILLVLVVAIGYVLSRATLSPLQAAYLRQKRFFADVAHEFRTPLSVLRTGSDFLLGRERAVDDYRSFIEIVRDESRHLATMTDDLLLLAKADNRIAHMQEPIDLSTLVHHTCEHMRFYADSKNILLGDTVEPNISVVGNGLELKRVVMNLLRNAIDYNKTSGSVAVTLAHTNTQAILTVQDTGVGIPAEAREAVFERFYKADQARTATDGGGTGLGLSIVQSLVRSHGGTIHLQSTIDVGTTVTVTIPLDLH